MQFEEEMERPKCIFCLTTDKAMFNTKEYIIQVIKIVNNIDWTARTIADLYKKRWDVELFFKALKQNLHVKNFVGTSENATVDKTCINMLKGALVCPYTSF